MGKAMNQDRTKIWSAIIDDYTKVGKTPKMFKTIPALRRVSIYVLLSYIALITVNNSGYKLENMWVIYAPMFVGIYIFSRWIDSKISVVKPINEKGKSEQQ